MSASPHNGGSRDSKREFEPVLCDVVKPWNEAKKKEFGHAHAPNLRVTYTWWQFSVVILCTQAHLEDPSSYDCIRLAESKCSESEGLRVGP